MAYGPHVRVQWGGGIYSLASGGVKLEEWSCCLSVADLAGATIEGVIDNVATILGTYHSSPDTGIDVGTALEYVKVNPIGATGRYANDETNVVFRDIRGGRSGSNAITTSCRVSLDDGTRNRRAKGGFFLPTVAWAIGDDWLFSTTAQAAIASSTSTMLASLNAIPSITVVIASGVAGSLTPVTRLRVGRRPDVIRTRANALAESYVVSAVVP